jgi:hypothetical protein
MILSYKHRNLTDATIDDFLSSEVQPTIENADSQVYLDLTFNRLNEKALGKVVVFMEQHDLIIACVGYNSFNFAGFYNTVAGMQHSDWIESERIHMGTTNFDRKLDKVAKANMEMAGNLNSMRLNIIPMVDAIIGFDKAMKHIGKLADVALNTNGWATRIRDTFEEVITTVTRQKLEDEGYTLLGIEDGKYRKLPYHIGLDGMPVDAVQWDGVLFMSKDDVEYTFLIEAKKTNNSQDMLSMPERLSRTRSFMDVCSIMLENPQMSKADKSRCYIWSLYRDSTVRCVLGAEVLPQSALDMVKQHNFIRVSHNQDGWVVVDEAISSRLE